jgi:hypothetical protein
VACRSQDNPRRTVPDGVPPGAANLGFRRLSCPRRLDWPPRRLDRPVLGVSARGFLITARSSAFVCSTRKSVNNNQLVPNVAINKNLSMQTVSKKITDGQLRCKIQRMHNQNRHYMLQVTNNECCNQQALQVATKTGVQVCNPF